MIGSEEEFIEAVKKLGRLRQQILELKNATPEFAAKTIDKQASLFELYSATKTIINEWTKKKNELLIDMDEYERQHNRYRTGDWMPLYSQKRIWLEDPHPDDIDIMDIAHSLAFTTRFNGHTKKPYSVAQHCVLGATYMASNKYKLEFLLHDAAEAYLGDIITPVKQLLGDRYESLESRIMDVIADKFDLDYNDECRREIKLIDQKMLLTEIRDLTTVGVPHWDTMGLLPFSWSIHDVWSPEEAESHFLEHFEYYYARRTNRV